MERWTTSFVNEAARKEFEGLPTDIKARLVRILDLFESKGLPALTMPFARHVRGKILELRATGQDGIARCLYVTTSGKVLVILRSFVKKTQKTPYGEIETALKRLREVPA